MILAISLVVSLNVPAIAFAADSEGNPESVGEVSSDASSSAKVDSSAASETAKTEIADNAEIEPNLATENPVVSENEAPAVSLYTAAPANDSTLEGEGTEASPYLIKDAADLEQLAANVSAGNTYAGKVVKLAANIDLGNMSWKPIGGASRSNETEYTGAAFQGTFDGAGCTITGLTVTGDAYGEDVCVGLFGALDGATVKNLTLNNVSINVPGNDCAGTLAGMVVGNTFISGVTVNGSVTAKDSSGGLVGRMLKEGHIENCVNNATVSGGGKLGGIVGGAYYQPTSTGMTIKNCTNNGAVSSKAGYVGGIAGLSAAEVSGCVNNASIQGAATGIGGIIGEQTGLGSVSGCTNSGNVTNNSDGYGTGGIVGWARYADQTNYTIGLISITNNVNTGVIDGGNDAGGIVGTVYNAAIVTGNENSASAISGKTFAAGIVGNIQYEPNNGNSDNCNVVVSNNISTTPADSIKAACVDPYAYNNNPVKFTGVKENGTAWIAQIGDTKYLTLQAAVDALTASGQAGTITLLGDRTGAGVVVPSGSDVTIDLNGYTYTVTSTVGSAGTVTNGFQLLKDSDITIKNGTVTTDSDDVKILVQNYSNLTLQDVTLDGTKSQSVQYMLSNNNGTTSIEGATSILAPDGAVAFDVYDYQAGGYSGANVTVDTTGTIDGNIEIGGDGTNSSPTLTIKNGTFDGKIIVSDKVAEKMKGLSRAAFSPARFPRNTSLTATSS